MASAPETGEQTADATPQSLFAPETLADPFAFYARMHARAPVAPAPGTPFAFVWSHELCSEATGRWQEFSNAFGEAMTGARAKDPEVKAILDTGWPAVDTMLTADPPTHTRFRKLVNLAFSMKRVDAMEADIRAKTVSLIERMLERTECDFVEAFAVPLPVMVIAGQLGMSDLPVETVKRWSDAFTDRLGGMASREREIECAQLVVAFQHHVKALIDARRGAATDDILSDLVHARVEGERPLDDAEIMSVLQQLMVAGNETTTSTLAGGLLHLIQNPGELEVLRADPSLIPNAVEEMLRLESPTAGMWRVVKTDTEIGGMKVQSGTLLHLRYAAANRDPEKYPEPDRFDVRRSNARTHLAFGRGIHMCIGNMLSRKELVVAFQELLARLDAIALQPGAKLFWPPNMLLRGLAALPIRYRAR
ncbi:MAG: cytochrome P450, partial [Thermaurantiacus sp.]